MMIAALIAAYLQGAPVTHERIGENGYRLRIQVPNTSEVERAQTLLMPEAQRLCDGRTPYFGHYRWDGQERMDNQSGAREAVSLTLEQDISCGAPGPVPAQTAAAPDSAWQPSPADVEAVLDRTNTYLAAKDSGRFRDAYDMLSPTNQAMATFETWSGQARAFNSEAGASRGRQLIRVTWYNDPPGAPVPGIYAAVDFNGDFAGLHFLCGYVVWLLQPDGSWQLVREEQNRASRADSPDMTAENIARIRAQYCRD